MGRRRLSRQERFEAILARLQETGYVTVAELSDHLSVSAVTARADLEALQRAGRLMRTHGGALPATMGEGALSFAVRQRTRVEEKERIGAVAAATVTDGEAIILDASTTAWHLARNLLDRHELTVLTTGLHVALELLRSPSITVVMPGGRLWHEAAALVGDWDSRVLVEGNYQKGFFGGRGLCLEEGLTDANRSEVELKRKLVCAAREVNVILDGSKLGKVAYAGLASVQEIHRVFTTRDAPTGLVEALRGAGIDVVIA
jgi:DeoR/GlpR family transcriptional regulator of sugar metabolism